MAEVDGEGLHMVGYPADWTESEKEDKQQMQLFYYILLW